jgi:CMP/dCMP kinase
MIITIDGPVASGKSSVAKAIASELGIYYLYTGLLYRAIAYVLVEKQNTVFSQDAFRELTEKLKPDGLKWVKDIIYDYENREAHIYYQDREITEYLHKSELDQAASIVSANKYVREALLDLQRSIGKEHNSIADGRDCGTVVFPSAEHKFYLTASVEERAKRVLGDELRENSDSLEETMEEIQERDERDSNREVAPLKIPKDAIFIDNSDLNLSQTIGKILEYL